MTHHTESERVRTVRREPELCLRSAPLPLSEASLSEEPLLSEDDDRVLVLVTAASAAFSV